MSVRCLCWNCGREIHDSEKVFEFNEELWCEKCFSQTEGKTKQENVSLDSVHELANAIVVRAVNDYVSGLVKKMKAKKMLRSAEKVIAECESFLRSEWYEMLTSVEAEKLIDVAKTQAEFLMWQSERGCAKCKFTESECPNRTRKANWFAWSKSNKSCLKSMKKGNISDGKQ